MAFIGEIQIFPGKYAPGGWYFCDGSLLSISEFPQLFQLIGTTLRRRWRKHLRSPEFERPRPCPLRCRPWPGTAKPGPGGRRVNCYAFPG